MRRMTMIDSLLIHQCPFIYLKCVLSAEIEPITIGFPCSYRVSFKYPSCLYSKQTILYSVNTICVALHSLVSKYSGKIFTPREGKRIHAFHSILNCPLEG